MAASAEEPKPVTIRVHGASGYRQGCRCAVCMDGERARRGYGTAHPAAVRAKGRSGEILKQTRKLIRSLDLRDTPEVALLKAQAVAGARALDEALAQGRPLSAPNRMHADAVKALKAAVVPPPPPPPGPVSEDDRDDITVWVAAIHRPSVVCQSAFPLVMPGACQRCDAAVMARALYGRRHPEKPRHEYGFSRADCGCQECAEEAAAAGEL